MIFFKKKHKFYPMAYGCSESLALNIFSNEKGNLESILGGKITATSIHHRDSGYVDYIVYTLEDLNNDKRY